MRLLRRLLERLDANLNTQAEHLAAVPTPRSTSPDEIVLRHLPRRFRDDDSDGAA